MAGFQPQNTCSGLRYIGRETTDGPRLPLGRTRQHCRRLRRRLPQFGRGRPSGSHRSHEPDLTGADSSHRRLSGRRSDRLGDRDGSGLRGRRGCRSGDGRRLRLAIGARPVPRRRSVRRPRDRVDPSVRDRLGQRRGAIGRPRRRSSGRLLRRGRRPVAVRRDENVVRAVSLDDLRSGRGCLWPRGLVTIPPRRTTPPGIQPEYRESPARRLRLVARFPHSVRFRRTMYYRSLSPPRRDGARCRLAERQ